MTETVLNLLFEHVKFGHFWGIVDEKLTFFLLSRPINAYRGAGKVVAPPEKYSWTPHDPQHVDLDTWSTQKVKSANLTWGAPKMAKNVRFARVELRCTQGGCSLF